MSARLMVMLIAGIGGAMGAPPAVAQRPIQFPLQAQTRSYRLQGTVIAVRPEARQLVIDARAIPGYMAALALPFAVRDIAVFDQVRPGDEISADIMVNTGASWLENVTVGVTPPTAAAGPMVDTTWDSARLLMDSIGIRPPPVDSIGIKPPPVDSVLRPNTMRDSTALRYPVR